MKYQLIDLSTILPTMRSKILKKVLDNGDEHFIPLDEPNNIDTIEYTAWAAAGNVAETITPTE